MNKMQSFFKFFLTAIGVVLTFVIANADVNALEEYEDEFLYIQFPDGLPVFDEHNIAPGDSFEKTIIVRNKDTTAPKGLLMEVEEAETFGGLSDVLEISITGGLYDFTGSLSELYGYGEYSLDILSPEEEKTYNLSVIFDEQAGNEYMGKLTKFDVTIGFSGGAVLGISDGAATETGELSEESGDVLGVTGQNTNWALCLGLFVGLLLLVGDFVKYPVFGEL